MADGGMELEPILRQIEVVYFTFIIPYLNTYTVEGKHALDVQEITCRKKQQ
jgi:hypothetical protein